MTRTLFLVFSILIGTQLIIGCATSTPYSSAPLTGPESLCTNNSMSSEVFRSGKKLIAEYYDRRTKTYVAYPVIATGAYVYDETRQRQFTSSGEEGDAPHYRNGAPQILVTTPSGQCYAPVVTAVSQLYQNPYTTVWHGIDKQGKPFGSAKLTNKIELTLYNQTTDSAFLSTSLNSTLHKLYVTEDDYTTVEKRDLESALAKLQNAQIQASRTKLDNLERNKQKREREQLARSQHYAQWQLESQSFINSVQKGSRICKFGPLFYHSSFQGNRKGEEDGYLLASVEAVSPDRQRVKVRVDGLWPGFKGKNDFITGIPKVGDTPVSPGEVLWDESHKWGICDY